MPETQTLPPVTYAVGEGPDDRTEITLTGYEKRIEKFVREHHAFFVRNKMDVPGPSKIKRLAYRLAKEQARTMDEDLWHVFNIPDPTPIEAIRNIEG